MFLTVLESKAKQVVCCRLYGKTDTSLKVSEDMSNSIQTKCYIEINLSFLWNREFFLATVSFSEEMEN